MHNKKIYFSVSNRRKCIANLQTLPMHYRQDFAKYKTQKVMMVTVYQMNKQLLKIKIQIKNSFSQFSIFNKSVRFFSNIKALKLF